MVSFADIWSFIKSSPAQVPTEARISPERVLDPIGGPAIIEPNKHYFVVQIDRIFLAYDRKWLREVNPVVLAISEYRYGRQQVNLPFIVGPSLLGDRASEVPQGMLYRRTRVAGIHPYRGGQLVMSIILCQSRTADYARRLVSLVEGLAGAVPFGEELGTYTRLANNLLDGIDALFGVGQTDPLVGFRDEYDHDIVGQELRPTYGVLIDNNEEDSTIEHLWVKDNDVMIGDKPERLIPFRDASFVLYSIRGAGSLSSINALPLTAGEPEIRGLMRSDKPENQETGRAKLLDLWDRLLVSPDVIEADAQTYLDGLVERIKSDRALAEALRLSGRAEQPASGTEEDGVLLGKRRQAISAIGAL